MLLFESCSAGIAVVFVGFLAVLTVVGVYVTVVWPLTFWDIRIPTEQYESWASTVLWSVFAGGALAGYWCFSGRAFKSKARKAQPPTVRSRR